jgi:dolichol-phosphate mannosyltransferase
MKTDNLPKITIVTPVYNEELCLTAYRTSVEQILFTHQNIYFEVIFIDDGSTDSSWQIIETICQQSPRFRAIRLSRNFGSHVALSVGIKHAKGNAIATLACDLQDPPEIILEFIKKWQMGSQIVWGKRKSRADKNWRKWTSHIFFSLLKKYAMPKKSKFTTGSFFLIDRIVAKCFNRFQEHNRITFALVAWTGFQQDTVMYDRYARFAGKSGWTFSQMLKTLIDAFVAFSNLPARIITTLGITLWVFSLGYASYLIIHYITTNVLPGWTGMMVFMSFMFGMVFLVLGLSMEYLRRIYTEVTNRPLYFIAKKLNFKQRKVTNEHTRELVSS